MQAFIRGNKNLIAIPLAIALILAALIFWREYELRDHVALYKVVLWQLAIWMPWVFGFIFLSWAIRKSRGTKYRLLKLFVFCAVLVSVHFAWFFLISSNFSPYIGQDGSGFGVFRYFFVFWTLIDIGLIWFVVDKLSANDDLNVSPPVLLELTRGKNKYFCEPSQIYMLASENYYTKLFTTEGVFLMRKPLKYFQDVLPKEFFKKIHRSTIINVNYVSELASGRNHRLEIVMKDGSRRSVSRNFTKEITLFFKDRTS